MWIVVFLLCFIEGCISFGRIEPFKPVINSRYRGADTSHKADTIDTEILTSYHDSVSYVPTIAMRTFHRIIITKDSIESLVVVEDSTGNLIPSQDTTQRFPRWTALQPLRIERQ